MKPTNQSEKKIAQYYLQSGFGWIILLMLAVAFFFDYPKTFSMWENIVGLAVAGIMIWLDPAHYFKILIDALIKWAKKKLGIE